MRIGIVVAIALIVVCVAVGLWLLHGYSVPQTVTKTMCNVVKEELIKRTIPINNVTWIEIIEGKKVIERCKLVEFVKKDV